MASLITVRLDKGTAPSLGFRLQGGKDFGTPLVIQKVNGGSPAERAGLIAGDSVIKINNTDVFNLRHKDAQDVIVRAGPSFEVTVQRGGSTWKPAVIPTGPLHQAAPLSPVTKTSLAARPTENIGAIGTGHNLSAKPFSPQLNGAVNGGPRLVNNQYNSPLKLYSEQSIAETLSAQTEVLSTGALGVNFKKNEKNYDATNSAVYRMLQEAEKEPKTPEAEPDSGVVAAPLGVTGLRHVSAPETKAPSTNPQLPPGQNICADCERLIVGVFVRIKDKNLHVECFKCSTCGTSLKNVGYYNINNKLYCDVHAKLAARNNPPAPNLVPVTVPPGGRAPANAISAALSSHSLPSPAPLSPRTNLAQPFQPIQDDKGADLSTPLQNLNITADSNNKFNNNLLNSTPLSFNKYLNKAGNYSTTPKPFSSVSAPNYNTLPKAAPLSPVVSAPAPSYSPASSADRSVHSFVWPPPPEEPEVPTACPLYFPPPTYIKVNPKPRTKSEASESYELSEGYSDLEEVDMAQFIHPKLSMCSEEVYDINGRRSTLECIETISETLETQQLVDSVLKNRPPSPSPVGQDVEVVLQLKKGSDVKEEVTSKTEISSCSSSTCELKRLSAFQPNTVECQLKSQVENAVPQQWESQMVQALRTVPDPFEQIPKKHSSSALASALAIAPSEPFTAQPSTNLKPVPLPELTEPYFPPEHPIIVETKEVKAKPLQPESNFVKALQTAPERAFTPVNPPPLRKKKEHVDELLQDLPKPQQKLTLRDALTTASERPYTPLVFENVKVEEKKVEEKVKREDLQRPLKPSTLPASFYNPTSLEKPQAPKPFPVRFEERREETSVDESKSASLKKHQTHSSTIEKITSAQPEQQEGFYPLFTGFSCSFEKMSDMSKFSVEVSTTPPSITTERSQTPNVKIIRTDNTTEEVSKEQFSEQKQTKSEQKIIAKQAEEVVYRKPLPLASILHKTEKLPQYQVNLSEDVEAEILMMEKAKLYEQKNVQQQSQPQTKPIIMIQPGDNNNAKPEQSFKPVSEERPQSHTFSPRPRPLTPSMINKPPPTIPYYQSSLVAQPCRAAEINLLDPTSPAVSRSPSPCPPEMRSPSPFKAKSMALRPKSPATGPPPNPLASRIPTPPPREKKEIKKAKKNVCSFIPQHKNKMVMMEKTQIQDQNLNPQMYVSRTEMQNITEPVERVIAEDNVTCIEQKSMIESQETENKLRAHTMVQDGMSTSVTEQSKLDHLAQMKKSEAHTTAKSTDGSVQIQRKKTVTEEFEHTQKAQTIQIEKNVDSTKHYPFRDVKNPPIEGQGIMGLHVTNPQPIVSPFLKTSTCQKADQPQTQAICKPRQTQTYKANPQETYQSPHTQPNPQSSLQPPHANPNFLPAVTKHVTAPSLDCPTKHVPSPSGSARKPCSNKSNIPVPNVGSGGGRQAGAIGVAPKRGRGVLNAAAIGGARIPLCASCHSQIRGPFITALGKIWCPSHFICATPSCRRPLQDLGFVEENGQLHCEYCFEQYLAPPCSKCNSKIKGDCLKAIGKNFHPECFNCVYCGKLFGNSPFFLEDGSPYCEADWNELFTTKCFACGFPVEAGDRWVEALNNNYHSQCFNCTMCKKNLEGQSFFAKGGRPFCKNHAR